MDTIKLPTSWDEVNLGTFQELVAFQEDIKGKSDLEIFINQLSILADADSETIRNMPLQHIHKAKDAIEFSSKSPEDKLIDIIEIDGIKYGMMPDLSRISLGEWVDIEEKIGESVTKNLHYVMAVIFRPIVETSIINGKYKIEAYDSETMLERAELFKKKMAISSCYGASLFFYRFANAYMANTLDSLEMVKTNPMILKKLQEKQRQKELEESRLKRLKEKGRRIGSGIVSSIVWLVETPLKWIKQRSYRSSTVSTTAATNNNTLT